MGSRDEKGRNKTEGSKIVEQAKVRLGKKESDGSSVRGSLGLLFSACFGKEPERFVWLPDRALTGFFFLLRLNHFFIYFFKIIKIFSGNKKTNKPPVFLAEDSVCRCKKAHIDKILFVR